MNDDDVIDCRRRADDAAAGGLRARTVLRRVRRLPPGADAGREQQGGALVQRPLRQQRRLGPVFARAFKQPTPPPLPKLYTPLPYMIFNRLSIALILVQYFSVFL